MEGSRLISKLLLIIFFANSFQCSSCKADFTFQRMVEKSTIIIPKSDKDYYPGFLLEFSDNVAIYKSKIADESIKVLYPIQGDRSELFENEIKLLRKTNQKFEDKSQDPVENGVARLIASGDGKWKHVDDEESLPGRCTAIVYTHGIPLFPILMQCAQTNDRKMLFWYFSQMAKSMASLQGVGKTYHNSIGPNVFRLRPDGTVVVDNFEAARSMITSSPRLIYVSKNDFPIGFKPTMSKRAMEAKKRERECQQYSFEHTSYYILRDRLPWQMDAIDFLWNFNFTQAIEITLELREIDWEEYFLLGDRYLIHPKILSVIKSNGLDYVGMSEQFLRMSSWEFHDIAKQRSNISNIFT